MNDTHTHIHTHTHSEEEEKGSDCIPQFRTMQECFQKYPEIYSKFTEDDEDEDKVGEEQEDEGRRKESTPSKKTIDIEASSGLPPATEDLRRSQHTETAL